MFSQPMVPRLGCLLSPHSSWHPFSEASSIGHFVPKEHLTLKLIPYYLESMY